MEQLSPGAETTSPGPRVQCSETREATAVKPMLRKATQQQRQSTDKLYTHRSVDTATLEGQALLICISYYLPEHQRWVKKQLLVLRCLYGDLLQVAYSVFDNRDMVEKAEPPREIHKGLMIIAALSLRPAEEVSLCRPSCMVDLRPTEYPDQPRMPCVDRRALEERLQ